MQAATIIIVIAGAYLSNYVRAAEYCGCGRANDQQKFPVYAHGLLEDLVAGMPFQGRDPASGYMNYITTNPRPGSKGAVYGSAICTRRLTMAECETCLSGVRECLRPCKTYSCGGAKIANRCSLDFWQME
ncbi:unnamed protein product [Linum trigynum]